MILYLDTSALLKRYVAEQGSVEVAALIAQATVVGTCMIARAEMSAALAKAVRMGTLISNDADMALQVFRNDWPHLARIQVTETVVSRADGLAWGLGLRGNDAVHLASALWWRDVLGEDIVFEAFDLKLRQAAVVSGLGMAPM